MDALFEEDAGPIEYQMETDTLEDEEISQEDAWVVIDKYFLERGSFILEQILDCNSKGLFSCWHLETWWLSELHLIIWEIAARNAIY